MQNESILAETNGTFRYPSYTSTIAPNYFPRTHPDYNPTFAQWALTLVADTGIGILSIAESALLNGAGLILLYQGGKKIYYDKSVLGKFNGLARIMMGGACIGLGQLSIYRNFRWLNEPR